MPPALIISSIFALLDLALKFRQTVRQTGEWTPEQESKFWQKVSEAQAAPHWQPSTPPTP